MGSCWSTLLVADDRLGQAQWLVERWGLVLPPYWWVAGVTFQVPLWVSVCFCRYGVARRHRWVVAGSGVCLGMLAWFQFMACTQEPGIIPRRVDCGPAAGDAGAWVGKQVMGLSVKDRDHIVCLDDGTRVVHRWCRTCRVHRAPRAGHCDTLDCCVEEYDHFCPVLASCVGRRTLRYFVGYLGSCGAFAAWIGGCTVYLSRTACAPGGPDHLDLVGREYMYLSASLGCGAGVWPALGFFYFLALICHEHTTREESRGLVNPYAETKVTFASRLRALKKVLWDPIPSNVPPRRQPAADAQLVADASA